MSARRKQLLWILAVFAVVLAADQITKTIVLNVLPIDTTWPDPAHPEFFKFSHQRNPGLVGGMLGQTPGMAILAHGMATLVLLYLFFFLDKDSKIQWTAFGMIAGGAIGNFVDRVRLGTVTDFLQFHFYFIPFDFPWKHYPAFNIADTCICTGVFILIVSWMFFAPKEDTCQLTPQKSR